MTTVLVRFETEQRDKLTPTQVDDLVQCFCRLRPSQQLSVGPAGPRQILWRATETCPVVLGIAEDAKVVIGNASRTERPRQSGLTEPSLTGDRRKPDIHQTRDTPVIQLRHEFLDRSAFVADPDQPGSNHGDTAHSVSLPCSGP